MNRRKTKRGGQREGAGRPAETGATRRESLRVLVTRREKAALIKLAGGRGRLSALLRRAPRDLARERAAADATRRRTNRGTASAVTPAIDAACAARIATRLGLPATATQDEIAAAVNAVTAERAVTRYKLDKIAKYADDLDAHGGPEDGGSYMYLAVAKSLQDILKDSASSEGHPVTGTE